MRTSSSTHISLRVGLLACAVTLSGCAGWQAFRQGQADLAEGRLESGLSQLKTAMEHEPRNIDYRRAYFIERDTAVNRLVRQADLAVETGSFDVARNLYDQARKLDPGNVRATNGAAGVDTARRHWSALDASTALAKKGDVDAAILSTQNVLSENPNHVRAGQLLKQLMRQQADQSGKELGLYPKLKAAYRKPVSLNFAGATLQQVFDALKLASGLNYMFDKDVRLDQRVTLSVSNKPVEDILRLLLATNQLERRVLDEDTLLIYPNTQPKAAEYREMVVRTFYLANSDVNRVANLLRTIVKAKDVVVDEKLNLIIMRDSSEAVRLAERVIATQDMAEPEVMLELEVLEVSASRLIEMGISWPSQASATVVGSSGAVGQLTLNELRNRTSDNLRLSVSDPLVAARLRSQVGNANLLANPRVRVRNKQSAKILIGERVPVFTTTSTANVGSTESVNYLDVGLKLDIEPTISIDGDVSMKLALEVSNILETITRASGTQAYRLGTRNTSTTLRVRDGETNVLAGLIQRDERRSNTGVPGLNEAPIVSKLFGAAQDSDSKTEIVLLVTPHIVRNIELPGVGLQEFNAGTDSAVGAMPIQLGSPGGANRPPPMPMPGAPAAPPVPIQGVTVPPARPTVPNQAPSPAPLSAPAPSGFAPAPTPPPSPASGPPPAFTPPPIVPASPSQSTPGSTTPPGTP